VAKQGGATVLGEGLDIATGETVILLSEHKHLRRSSCSTFYSCLLLRLGLCQTQPVFDILIGFSYSAPHRYFFYILYSNINNLYKMLIVRYMNYVGFQ
jgi:hypothetical protein